MTSDIRINIHKSGEKNATLTCNWCHLPHAVEESYRAEVLARGAMLIEEAKNNDDAILRAFVPGLPDVNNLTPEDTWTCGACYLYLMDGPPMRTECNHPVPPRARDQYKSLNDAAGNKSIAAQLRQYYASGTTEVWYMRPVWFPRGILGGRPNLSTLEESHARVGAINCIGAEMVFAIMQGENWSPVGEANKLIRSLGLSHTSMSMGDIIIETHNGVRRTLLCCETSFEELK